MKHPTYRSLAGVVAALVSLATLSLFSSRARTQSHVTQAARTTPSAALSAPLQVSPFDLRTTAGASSALFAPVVTVTKSATRVTTTGAGGDVNGNGFLNPGDTLMYSVVVSNTAAPGAGNDALGVVFTDQLNGNLSLVAGTVNASPIGTNDTYACLGNVGINVPAANGVLANDVDPNGNAITVQSVNSAGLQGVLSLTPATGAFQFTPNPGFEGTTTFTYVVTDGAKTDTATVTINVSGMIWFIDNNAGPTGDGRLGAPFNSLANFVSLAADDPGDNIFLYRNTATNYTGPLTLLNNQKLGGQGMTVTLASFTGLTVPPFSNALPTTSGTRPVIAVSNNNGGNNLTLGAGNTLRGFNLMNTSTNASAAGATGAALIGTNFGNLTASEITISNTANNASQCTAAVNLNNGNPTASFTAISANNCANGIILQSTTGSFTVIGDGTNTTKGGNASGGTIQNIFGADEAIAGNGIYLNNASNIVLRRMTLNGTIQNMGVYGQAVNNFTMQYCTVGGTIGTTSGANDLTEEGPIVFGQTATENIDGFASGSVSTIDNCLISGGIQHNVEVYEFADVASITISNSNITNNSVALGSDGIQIETHTDSNAGTPRAQLTVNVNNCMFDNNKSQAMQASALGDSFMDVTANQNTVQRTTQGNEGIVFQNGSDGDMIAHITNNTISGIGGTTIFVGQVAGNATASSSLSAVIQGNTVTQPATATNRPIIAFLTSTVGQVSTANILINNNMVSAPCDSEGIFVSTPDANTDPSFTATVTNNTVTCANGGPAGTALRGIGVQSTQAISAGCFDVRSNTVTYTGGAPPGVNGLRVRQAGSGTAQLEQGISAGAAATVLAANNPGSTTEVVGTVTVVANSTCQNAPSFAPPLDVENPELRLEQKGANSAPSGSIAMATLGRLRQMLRPVFTAFAAPLSYAHLERAFDTVAPAIAAAELSGNGATVQTPAKTLVINSRGEYRIVPTAALPKLMAGELITVNGTGSGFTLPAGESTTIMFNATIGTSFTGTAITNQASVSGMGFGPILSNNLSTPVIQAPNFSKAFSPTAIYTNIGVSTLTFTLVNPNPGQALSSVAFTDSLPADVEVAAVPMATLSNCGAATFTPSAGATSLSFSGGSIAIGTTCTASVKVRATAVGTKNNTSSTATSAQANPSGTAAAALTVFNAPTSIKEFAPATILSGGTSTVTLTLGNTNATPFTNASFTDTLTNMSAVGGAVGGTCTGTTPATLTAGATALSFSGITIPANGSCTVSFAVTSSTVGERSNTASGITTTQVATASPASNPAILTVFAPVTVNKAFAPATIQAGTVSTVTLTLANNNFIGQIASFSDTLTNMAAVGGAVGGTCPKLAPINFAANDTNLNFTGIALAANSSCTVTFGVRSSVVGVQPNTTSGVTTDFVPTAGPMSNTANLTVNAPTTPTVAKAFNPMTIPQGGTSTVTLTLNNAQAFTVLADLSDTLANMTAVGGPIGSTCATLSAISLTPGATNVSLSGLVLPANGSCAVSFAVTSNVPGTHPNTTSGVTTDRNAVPGPVSNTVSLTVSGGAFAATRAVRNDFDGDGKSDLARWRNDTGEWEVVFSTDGELHRIALLEPSGKDEYLPAAADFDGDRRTDAAVWRARDGAWFIQYSLGGERIKAQYGLPGDTPMPADYDGDGRADLAVWRNGDGWHIQRSNNLTEQAIYLGQAGDLPVIGDFNGDGLMDVAAFQASAGRWLLRDAATGEINEVRFGRAGDAPMAADVDGDGQDDLIVMRPAEGLAYARRSLAQEVQRLSWSNLPSDEAVVFGDYDGDGKDEPAVWRVVKATWEMLFKR